MRGRHLDAASPGFVGGAKIEPLDQSVVCSSFGHGNSKNSGLLFPRAVFFFFIASSTQIYECVPCLKIVISLTKEQAYPVSAP